MKTVLMLAHWFPPCSVYPTAAARSRGFAAWLNSFGWRPIVVAPEPGSVCIAHMGEPRPCDGCQQADGEIEAAYRVIRVPVRPKRPILTDPQLVDEGRAAAAIRTAAIKAITLPRLILSTAGRLDEHTNWPRAAEAVVEQLLRNEPVDALWASHAPASSLWAAARSAHRHGLPWVADLRDSIALTWELAPNRRRLPLTRVRRILRRANIVVDVTPQHSARDSAWLERHCETITSGFDPREWETLAPQQIAESRSQFEIVFAGEPVVPLRTLSAALAGLRLLRQGDKPTPLRLVYYGRSPHILQKAASRCGVADLLDCRGFLSPQDIRARLITADVLLLPTNDLGYSGIPGGKLYEYLAARRPILAVPGRDRFVNEVLRQTGAGVTASEPEEVAGALRCWIDEWHRTGSVPPIEPNAAIDRYAVPTLTERLAELLDRAVAEGPSRRG